MSIIPRTWSDDEMDFVADEDLLKDSGSPILLASANFQAAAHQVEPEVPKGSEEVDYPAAEADRIVIVEETTVPDRFAMVLLRFFRDLSPSQRIQILVRLEALPPTWNGAMTHGMERTVVDKLMKDGRLAHLEAEIKREQSSRSE
ncbi:hypothetical protein AJ88_14070 [Mesorhizobium amorphae CCBAU 01583]|nr:hypothetical protein AJ88_14070 [Mesorhizobium amorphae CCBAU 01583]